MSAAHITTDSGAQPFRAGRMPPTEERPHAVIFQAAAAEALPGRRRPQRRDEETACHDNMAILAVHAVDKPGYCQAGMRDANTLLATWLLVVLLLGGLALASIV